MATYKMSPQLRELWKQARLDYEATLQAVKLGNHKEAVQRQLQAIDSLNVFNDKLLSELDRMREPERGTVTWAP